MKTEEKKSNETKTEGSGFGCCGPENFEKMFEKMRKCCPAQSDSTDYSTMMNNMMGLCSRSKTGDA